jgi:hypothetical protein
VVLGGVGPQQRAHTGADTLNWRRRRARQQRLQQQHKPRATALTQPTWHSPIRVSFMIWPPAVHDMVAGGVGGVGGWVTCGHAIERAPVKASKGNSRPANSRGRQAAGNGHWRDCMDVRDAMQRRFAQQLGGKGSQGRPHGNWRLVLLLACAPQCPHVVGLALERNAPPRARYAPGGLCNPALRRCAKHRSATRHPTIPPRSASPVV